MSKTTREIAADILIAALATGKVLPDGGTAKAKAECLARMYEVIRTGIHQKEADK